MKHIALITRAKKMIREQQTVNRQLVYVLNSDDPLPDGHEKALCIRLHPSKPQDDPYPKRIMPCSEAQE